VRGADELYAALGDRPRGKCLRLHADLVNDHDLRHVVLDCLDHHGVLHFRCRDLHPARVADRGVGDVTVPRDLV